MNNLIERNYESIKNRGLITHHTTNKEFNDKLQEEIEEFNKEYSNHSGKYPASVLRITEEAAIELIDIALVIDNWLHHAGYDPIKLKEEKIKINEERAEKCKN